jgi:SAM-dependent methyltransferase
MLQDTTPWYDDWFSSPYYHTLYRDRNEEEAAHFMDNLTAYLELEKGSHLLDVACGRGRHARYLHTVGYEVTGIDLSRPNIHYARQFAEPKLHFEVHDMRKPYNARFDAVLNLFTSFAYFEDASDNQLTVNSLVTALKNDGKGVIDFLNARVAVAHLIQEEVKEIEGITFNISRRYEASRIVKDIRFKIDGRQWHFTEKVQALTKKDFEIYLERAGARLYDCFGNYELDEFDPDKSTRLILIFGR